MISTTAKSISLKISVCARLLNQILANTQLKLLKLFSKNELIQRSVQNPLVEIQNKRKSVINSLHKHVCTRSINSAALPELRLMSRERGQVPLVARFAPLVSFVIS